MDITLPAVFFDGCYRVLGCIPSSEESANKFPSFGASFQMAAAVDPQEIDISWYGPDILNQGATSSCMGHSVASACETAWVQGGRPYMKLNPYWVYGLCNNGRDQGAMISDGLAAAQDKGVCERAMLPQGVMFQQQFPQAAYTDAQRFKIGQAYRCATFEDIVSAISLGFPTPLGIYVDQGFAQLDSDGIASLPRGQQGGGHAILGIGLKKHQRYGWLIKIQNSWGANYGMKGYAYIHKGHFQMMQPDAFALQAMIDDPQDSTNVVPVVTG